MSSFNFKSAICTSREQSEKLLALGLKKETADCCYYYYDGEYLIAFAEDAKYPSDIPAWSLHRLIEMMPKYVPIDVENGPIIDWAFDKWNIMYDGACYAGHVNPYKAIIEVYEWLIKEGYFNKEYLV